MEAVAPLQKDCTEHAAPGYSLGDGIGIFCLPFHVVTEPESDADVIWAVINSRVLPGELHHLQARAWVAMVRRSQFHWALCDHGHRCR